MRKRNKTLTAYIISLCFLVTIGLVYLYKSELFILAKPIVKTIVLKALNTPEYWGPKESKFSSLQSKSIDLFIQKQLTTLPETRLRINKEKTEKQLRNELCETIGVWNDGTSGKSTIIGDNILYRTYDYELHDITVRIYNSELLLKGLLAIPIKFSDILPPLIVAIHGTACGPEVLFNDWPNFLNYQASYDVTDYHHAMGSCLVKQGFMVFAPQLITEMTNRPITGFNERRNQLHMHLLPLGFTLRGIELTMISSAITALEESKKIKFDTGNIGAIGVSLGGATAFYLTALDERIKATVVSQWIENRDQKLLGINEYANWRFPSSYYSYTRGFSLIFSDTEMMRLILPRSLFIEAGIKDSARCRSALEKYNLWVELFPKYVADSTIAIEVGMGGHEVQLKYSLEWLKKRLNIKKR